MFETQKVKISTRMKKFHFWVKYAVFFYQKQKRILKNSVFFCYTWSNDHIQQTFRILERSDQYSTRYDMLKFYPFGIAYAFSFLYRKMLF